MSRAWLFPIVLAALAAIGVAALGATITDTGTLYHSLAQRGWAPPDAIFAAAWTGVYALTAISGVTAWLAMPTWRESEWLLGMFALNGFLNILWSLLFFRLHHPDLAMAAVLALWMSIMALMVIIWRRSKIGAILLIPYLLWVSFAGYLNMAVFGSNGPFG